MSATAEPMQPPRRAYREPARAETIKCPSCGAAITLKTFGTSERVACPFCGSLLGADESGALALVQAAARARQPTTLPLHARGTLDGVVWEIIGICKRSCRVDGVVYPWEEFYLYNPYHGFRWLIHAITDDHWTYGGTLDASPRVASNHLRHRGRRYNHFQSAIATVDYVEGEFTWQVEVGDQAKVNDYVAPPLGISIEVSRGPDGDEVNRTIQRSITPKEIEHAFNLGEHLPRPQGAGMLEPNPWRLGRRTFAAWGVVLLLGVGAWGGLAAVTPTHRLGTIEGAVGPVSQTLTVTGDRPTLVTVEVHIPALKDNWRYFEGMLVDTASEAAIGFELEVSYYSGSDWSEGSTRTEVVLGDVAPGAYVLQLDPTSDGPGATALPFSVDVHQGGVLHRYLVSLLVFAGLSLALPIFFGLLFERRRWMSSDHPPA
ncbi:MAG: DUF4178 domain-containing protein [Myxococcales bacterium]|nr:DUF4178 domain-containing protein [Myxococcales bacterium]